MIGIFYQTQVDNGLLVTHATAQTYTMLNTNIGRRNNKMVSMKTKLAFFVITSFLIQSCNTKVPNVKELSGRWYNKKDKAELILKEDNSFTIKNLPYSLIEISDSTLSSISGNGKWELQQKGKSWDQMPFEIYLYFKESKGGNVGGFPLVVSGSGFFENKPPYNKLFLWIGDPDEANRYNFTKQ